VGRNASASASPKSESEFEGHALHDVSSIVEKVDGTGQLIDSSD
jgi:hypothetical protein